MRATRTMAMVGALALALTACSGDGGETALGADAGPAEVVAAGLGDRLENGAAFTLTLEGDLDAIAARTGEPVPPEVEEVMSEGLVSGAFSPDAGFALTIGANGGFFEVRVVEEALYLRLDLARVAETFPDAGDVPSPEVLRGQLASLPLAPELSALLEAALDGQWVGITGLSQQALEDFASTMGGTVPSGEAASEQQDAVRSLLEERGLLDGQAFTERYLTVEGDGPTYALTVMARELVVALDEIAAEAEGALGPAAGQMGDLPSADEVPESLSGFAVTVEDGKATSLAADIALIADSAGQGIDEISAGELVVNLALSDLGDQLAVPDATTIAFEELVTGVMGSLLGGGLSG